MKRLPHFSIIICSYNNEKWCVENVESCLRQNYPNFTIYYIDDCSQDKTADLIDALVRKRGLQDKVKLIHNKKRKGSLANLYEVINRLPPDDIVCLVDGDDLLPHVDVLATVAQYYRDKTIWMTYGNYRTWPFDFNVSAKKFPKAVIEKSGFRSFPWVAGALRTFYAKLFQLIKKRDLTWKRGQFFPMSGDLAYTFPMLEMCARNHFVFIDETLYLYNLENPLNDWKLNIELQNEIETYIRKKKAYKCIKRLLS